jgi:hypothetical protein
VTRRAIDNTAREVERAIVRRAALLASSPTIHRHGDAEPERDYYSIHLLREDCGGGFVAHRMSWDLEQRFRATYGKHDADSLWSYEVPDGAKEVYES